MVRKTYEKIEIEESVKKQLRNLSFSKDVTLKELATEILRCVLNDPKKMDEIIKSLQKSS